jgi:hypothetical protein
VWSSSLLLFVTPACLWLHVAGARAGVSRAHQLAFLVLAFLGAVSAAFPLAMAHVHALDSLQRRKRAGSGANSGGGRAAAAALAEPVVTFGRMVTPCALAVGSALVLPYTVHRARGVYVACLVCLHVVLLVPAALNPTAPLAPPLTAAATAASAPVPRSPWLAGVYAALAGAAVLQHWHALAAFAFALDGTTDAAGAKDGGFAAGLGALLAAGWASKCQASISWDAVLSAGAGAALVLAQAPLLRALPLVAAMPLVSPAACFAAFCALAELDPAPSNPKPQRRTKLL